MTKILKVFLIILVGLFVLLFSLGSWFGDSIIESVVKDKIAKASKNLYKVSIGETEFSLFAGGVLFKNFHITSDTALHQRNGNALPLLNLQVEVLDVDGVSVLAYFFQNKLEINEISFYQPQLELELQVKKDTSEPTKLVVRNWDIYPALSKKVKQLKLGALQVKGLKATIRKETVFTVKLDSLDLGVEDILIDSATMFSEDRTYYAREIDFNTKKLRYDKINERSSAHFNQIKVASKKNILSFSIRKPYYHTYTEVGDTIVYAVADSIKVLDLNSFKYAQKQVFDFNEALAFNPQLAINKQNSPNGGGGSGKKLQVNTNMSLEQLFPYWMKGVYAERVAAVNGGIRFITLNKEYKAKHVDIRLQKVVVDSLPGFAENRFFHADTFYLQVVDLKALSADTYQIKADTFFLFANKGTADLQILNTQGNYLPKQGTTELVEFTVPLVGITSINYTKVVPEQRLMIDTLLVKVPKAKVVNKVNSATNSSGRQSSTEKNESLYPFISSILQALQVDQVLINEGELLVEDTRNRAILKMPTVNFGAQGVLVTKNNAFEEGRIYHAKDLTLGIQDFICFLPDQVYILKAKEIGVSTSEKNVFTKGFHYQTRYKTDEAIRRLRKNDILDINVAFIAAKVVDFDGLMRGKRIAARKVMFNNFTLYSFKDKNKSEPKKKKPMPQEALKQLNWQVLLNEVVFADARFTYEEIMKGADTAGMVFFNDFDIRVKNLTNIPSHYGKGIDLNAVGKLMDSGEITTYATFSMLTDSNRVEVAGHLYNMELEEMNKIARYNTKLVFQNGYVDSLKWNFVADEQLAEGVMFLNYKNLDFELSEVGTGDTTGVLKELGTEVVSALIKDDGVHTDTVQYSYKRNQEKSFLNYYWKTLLSGLKEGVGFTL